MCYGNQTESGKKRAFFRVLTLLVLLVAPANAFAGGITIMGADSEFEVKNNDIVSFYAEKNRSYACTFFSPAVGGVTVSAIGAYIGSPVAPKVRTIGAVTPMIDKSSHFLANNRFSIIPAEDGRYAFGVGGEASDATVNAIKVNCVETSLYGGYNTNVNQYNFLEVINTTNDNIKAWITAKNFDGVVVIDSAEVVISPDSRSDFDIHTAAGPGKFGMLKVIHDGPEGALKARLSEYRITSGGFEQAISTVLTSREQ